MFTELLYIFIYIYIPIRDRKKLKIAKIHITLSNTESYISFIVHNSHFLRQKAKRILTHKVSVAISPNLRKLQDDKSPAEG